MEAGNPKQVAVLSVVAVAALGFLFTRMRGSDLPKMAQAMVDKATGHQAAALPTYPMVSDPFSHPRLASNQTPASLNASAAVESEKSVSPPFVGGPLNGPLSGGPLPLPGDPSKGDVLTTTTRPVKADGGSDASAPKVPEGTEILLEATAGASDAVAFLSIGGAESQPFHANDPIKSASIKGKVRLLRVEDGAVVLSGPKGEFTINVGERKRI